MKILYLKTISRIFLKPIISILEEWNLVLIKSLIKLSASFKLILVYKESKSQLYNLLEGGITKFSASCNSCCKN